MTVGVLHIEASGKAWPSRLPSPRVALAGAVGVCAAVVAVVSAMQGNPTRIGAYGLVSALPWPYFVGLGVLLASICYAVAYASRRDRFVPIVVLLVVLEVLVLHGAAAYVESIPRFATAWLHVGFSDQLIANGRLVPRLDARYSWPGFFVAVAFALRVVGMKSSLPLLNAWPLLAQLIYLPFVFLLARGFSLDRRRAWLCVAFFPLLSWIGQDYFSPQSLAFALYLAFLVVVCNWERLRSRSSPAQNVVGPRVASLIAAVILFAALVPEHQLTPYIALVALALLAVTRQTTFRWVILAFAVACMGWLCWGASDYWLGHLRDIFGGVGSIGTNVDSGLGAKVTGSVQHSYVVLIRIAFAGVVGAAGAVGLWLRRRQGESWWALAVLVGTPLVVLGAQSYGGENLLRAYLLASPALVVAAAALLRAATGRRLFIITTVAMLVLVPAFELARWGNESYEQATRSDIDAFRSLVKVVPANSVIATASPDVYWQFTDLTAYDYRPSNLSEFAALNAAGVDKILGDANPGYLLITPSQVAYGVQVYGLPSNWADSLEASLTRSGRYRVVFSHGDATLYERLAR